MNIFYDEISGEIIGISKRDNEFDNPYIEHEYAREFLSGNMITDSFLIMDGALHDKNYVLSRMKFNSTISDMDSILNITTYFTQMTLSEIAEKYIRPRYPDIVSWKLNSMMDAIFPTEQDVTTTAAKLYASHPVQMKTLFGLDVLHRETVFVSPIGISFSENDWPLIHPGSTRVLFHETHPEKIDVYVSFHDCVKPNDLDLIPITDVHLPHYNYELTINDKNIEINGLRELNKHVVYESSQTTHGPMIIEKKDNILLVNHVPLLKMNDARNWSFV